MDTLDSRPLLLRRVIIDVLPYGTPDEDLLSMQERMGLVPSSLDVLELDKQESKTRINGLRPISDALTTMSGLSAEAIAEYFLMQVVPDDDAVADADDGDDIPVEYLRQVLVRQNMNVIVAAVHGIVSHLVASGILVVNKESVR
jgi:hypothetical protein